MPTKPKIVTLTNSSVDILNAIRNSASTNYKDYVPVATADPEVIRTIGAVIMDYPALQNEFLHALVNRIGRVIVESKQYDNPWTVFKKGVLEFGETIEDIFVNIAKPFQFDPEVAETEVFKREIPDVRSTFYVMNYQKFYKATISEDQLKQAFVGIDGVTNLIAKITESLYTGANYDEYQTMKYMLGRRMLDGMMNAVTVPAITTEDGAKSAISTIKGVSNTLEFLSPKYNLAGVQNFTLKDNQYVIIDTRADAFIDVNVLASAFNMDKAEFLGHKITVDGFGNVDSDRLEILFADDKTYKAFTEEEKSALDKISICVVDENFFQIYDNMNQFTENYNGQGLYWQYFYHVWRTFAVSPFSNNAVFVPGTPSVTSVSVSPDSATVKKGQQVQLAATVDTEYFAPQTVNWTSSDTNVTVSASGLVSVSDSANAGEVTITATSVFDSTKTSTATITVQE